MYILRPQRDLTTRVQTTGISYPGLVMQGQNPTSICTKESLEFQFAFQFDPFFVHGGDAKTVFPIPYGILQSHFRLQVSGYGLQSCGPLSVFVLLFGFRASFFLVALACNYVQNSVLCVQRGLTVS